MSDDDEAAADFLEFDLCDTADLMREKAEYWATRDPRWSELHAAAADRLDQLASEVELIRPTLLAEYAAARRTEGQLVGDDGPDCIHCSMTMEIGFLLDPRTIEDVVRIYVCAVDCLRGYPRWAEPRDFMADFWREFARAGHA
jgi:hypothetical protein